MAAFNIQEALIWKEKIESVIDQVCPHLLIFTNMLYPYVIELCLCFLMLENINTFVLVYYYFYKYYHLSSFYSFHSIIFSILIMVWLIFWVSCSALRKFQHQESQAANGNKYLSFEYKSGMDNGRKSSSSDRESQ